MTQMSSERDLGLRDEGRDVMEVEGVTAWFVTKTPDVTLEKMKGNVVIERDPIPPHDTMAWFVPDIFVRNLRSDIYTETIPDAWNRSSRREIPKRYYIGFGRAVAPTPNTVLWSSVWNDGSCTDEECRLTFIRHLEDYMLDGVTPIEELEAVIEVLGQDL